MSRFLCVVGAAAVILASAIARPACAATPASVLTGNPGPLFTQVRWLCGASDYLAFEGEDDWLPNSKTREKLVVLTWRDGIRTQTLLLDRDDSPDGMSCERDNVALLVNGPDRTFRRVPVQLGATLARLPAQGTTISSNYGEPSAYDGILRGLRVGIHPKSNVEATFVLGTTPHDGTASLAVKITGSLELGTGYTQTERITLSTGGARPSRLMIEDWNNFTPAD
jgi:hypothetical protein